MQVHLKEASLPKHSVDVKPVDSAKEANKDPFKIQSPEQLVMTQIYPFALPGKHYLRAAPTLTKGHKLV